MYLLDIHTMLYFLICTFKIIVITSTEHQLNRTFLVNMETQNNRSIFCVIILRLQEFCKDDDPQRCGISMLEDSSPWVLLSGMCVWQELPCSKGSTLVEYQMQRNREWLGPACPVCESSTPTITALIENKSSKIQVIISKLLAIADCPYDFSLCSPEFLGHRHSGVCA